MRYKILILFFCLMLACSSVFADEGTSVCFEDFMADAVNGVPKIRYTGRTKISMNMRSAADKESESLGVLKEGDTVQIFGFDQVWLFCWDETVGIYYIGRHNVDDIQPVSEDIPPYGVIPNRFVASTAVETPLLAAPNTDAEVLATYPADTRVSFWHIVDGWAVVPYRRVVGYLYMGDMKDLTPVSPSVEYAQVGDILAAFTTFYSTKQTELNIGRMENLRVGSNYISKVYQPGESFSFNQVAGPYRKNRGYMDSPVLINGESVAGSGGGTCQISTTLYNALLQLPDGIIILYRHAHGPSGATYAPHGVDAAVGRDLGGGNSIELDLRFRNDYDFPIALDCSVQNGALCICIRKAD